MHQHQASQRFLQLIPYSIDDSRLSWDLTIAVPLWVIFTLYVCQCIRVAAHRGWGRKAIVTMTVPLRSVSRWRFTERRR